MENFESHENIKEKPFEKEFHEIEKKFSDFKPKDTSIENLNRETVFEWAITIHKYTKQIDKDVNEIHYQIIQKWKNEIVHIVANTQSEIDIKNGKIKPKSTFLTLKTTTTKPNKAPIYSNNELQDKKNLETAKESLKTIWTLRLILHSNTPQLKIDTNWLYKKPEKIDSSQLYQKPKPKVISKKAQENTFEITL